MKATPHTTRASLAKLKPLSRAARALPGVQRAVFANAWNALCSLAARAEQARDERETELRIRTVYLNAERYVRDAQAAQLPLDLLRPALDVLAQLKTAIDRTFPNREAAVAREPRRATIRLRYKR